MVGLSVSRAGNDVLLIGVILKEKEKLFGKVINRNNGDEFLILYGKDFEGEYCYLAEK